MAGDSARANMLNYHLIRTGLGWRYTLESKQPMWSAAGKDLRGMLGMWESLPDEIAARNQVGEGEGCWWERGGSRGEDWVGSGEEE